MLTYPVDLPLERYIFRATEGGRCIGTARQTQADLRGHPERTLVQLFAQRARGQLIAIAPGRGMPIPAEINYGRWLVRCPLCGGAEDVDPGEPLFLCTACGSEGVFQPVVFPPQRSQIENLLLRRPIRHRNWMPGETPDFLDRENRQNGVN